MNINDYAYKTVHTDEHMAAAKNWLIEGTKNHSFSGTANFAIVQEDGEVRSYTNQGCHYSIGIPGLHCPASLVVTETFIHAENRHSNYGRMAYDVNGYFKRYDRDASIMMPFHNWLLNESVWGRFILNRDDPETNQKGFIVSAGLPAAILQGIMILSRHFYEITTQGFEKFNELIEKGIPKSVAYMCAFNTSWGYLGEYAGCKPDKVVTGLYGHRVFALPKDFGVVRNFITGTVEGLDKKRSYREYQTTSGPADLFGPTGRSGGGHFISTLIVSDEGLREALAVSRGTSGEPKAIANPFAMAPRNQPRPTDVTYKEMFDVVLPYLNEKGYFKDAIH